MRLRSINFSAICFSICMLFFVTANAEKFGVRVVSDCYHLNISLINISGTDTRTIMLGELFISALDDVASAPYLNQNILSTPIPAELVCVGTQYFCCAKFKKLPDSTPNVPLRLINGVVGKWEVISLHFDN